MATAVSTAGCVSVDGKFFRLGGEKFYPKGVCYGPFAPNGQQEPFCSPEQTAADFAQMRTLGANLVRVYEVPAKWFLDLAAANDLRLLIDVAWNKHACFGHSAPAREAARKAVRRAAEACYRHPAVFALSMVNEVPPDIVRWLGAAAVEEFIDELVDVVKAVDPERLCTFGNYPPTEYLQAKETDFVCFNVYLHQANTFRNYLGRLQMLADTKPLMLGECGIDSVLEGESRQAELLASHVETAFRQGLAGVVVYSWTDEWFKDGRPVEEWHFGLCTCARQLKPAFAAVQNQFRAAPYYPPPRCPKVSVVVACYNGARTLKLCLEALARLRYPDYEVILVDDGSSDATPQIAAQFPAVRCLRQPHQGLAVARNTGIAAATGQIIAFTDSDCRPDEDWLHYLVSDLLRSNFAGIGGHNLLPADDSAVAGAVMVSPGGPAHVMLTDRVAEHIPGCNMAFWKWALLEVGCFDPVFEQAGDDVDLCWRLQQRGYQLGFSPAGFVWHYRRSTVGAYLKQQRGYGAAEALLERKHPEYFNPLGGSIWRGRIYTPANVGLLTRRPIVYHGLFAGGLFQSLYTAPPMLGLMLLTSVEYHVLVNLPLLVLAVMFRWLIPVALASVLISAGTCIAAAAQAQVPKKKRRFWSRPLVAALFALQPIVRGWARYRGRLFVRRAPLSAHENLDSLSRKQQGRAEAQLHYRTKPGFVRAQFLEHVLAQLEQQGWQFRADAGWSDFDVEIHGSRWSRLQLTTVSEITQEGQHVLRCRLRTAWSLPARLVFWAALGLELLVISLVGHGNPWLWLLVLTLPGLAWWLERDQRDLRRLIGVFLDELGKRLDLQKLEQ